MKNYYEILEVDKNASQEVIDKAYKTLVKKYHPDLQQGLQKQEYSEKMKIINEAYHILSDSFKRGEYNKKLQNEEEQNQTISKQEQERIMQENYALKQQLNKIENSRKLNNRQEHDGTILNMSRIIEQQIKNAQRQAYHDAYVQDMKNRGYKIRYKHNLKYYFKLLLVVLITIFVLFLIYQIPFVKAFFSNLYKDNILFKAFVDVFKNTFSATF